MEDCSRRYCAEWKSPSLQILLFIESIILLILFAISFLFSTEYSNYLESVQIDTPWKLICLYIYLHILIILITVYAPYQHHMIPQYYKLISIMLFGLLTIIMAGYDLSGSLNAQMFNFPQYHVNQFTLCYLSLTLIWPFLLPYLTALGYIIIGWQIMEAIFRDGRVGTTQRVNLFGAALLMSFIFFFWYFINKCSSNNIRQFPLISSKNSFRKHVGRQEWFCQPYLLKCWENNCSWWFSIRKQCLKGPSVVINKNQQSSAVVSDDSEDIACALKVCQAYGGAANCNIKLPNPPNIIQNEDDDGDIVYPNLSNINIEPSITKSSQHQSNLSISFGHSDRSPIESSVSKSNIPGSSQLSVPSMSSIQRSVPSIGAAGAAGGTESIPTLSDINDGVELVVDESKGVETIEIMDSTSNILSKYNNVNNDDDSKDGGELMAAISHIASMTPERQYKVMADATRTMYMKAIESINEERRARYEKLAKMGKIGKIVNDNEEHVKCDIRYLEMNMTDGYDSSQEDPQLQEDRVGKYVKGQLEEMIERNVRGKAYAADRCFTAVNETHGNNGLKINLTKKGFRRADCSNLIDVSLLTNDASNEVYMNNIILIEGGCLIGDICDHFWPPDKYNSLVDENNRPYKVLPNRPGYKWLSLIGLASTGSMGTSGYNALRGCNKGAFQSMILSFRMLTIEDGNVVSYQIEPMNGRIHNSIAKERYAANGIKLIQDDEIFSDTVTSLGTYGVITHAYIKLEDAYYLDVYIDKTPFDKWEEKFEKVINDNSVDMWQAWFNPYHVSSVTPASMVTTIYRRSQGPPNTQTEIKQYGGVNRGKVSLDQMELTSYIAQTSANSGLWQSVAVVLEFCQNLVQFTNESKILTMSCVQALDFGTPAQIPSITNGISFPVSQTIDVINSYVRFLNKQVNHGPFEQNLCISSPFALRFCKKSCGSISCAADSDIGWIEQPIATIGNNYFLNQTGYDTAYRNGQILLQRIRHHLFDNFESKIHWGLWFAVHKPMNEIYPWFQHISNKNLSSFKKNYKKFNKDGYFSNVFTARSGLDGDIAMVEIEDIELKEKFYEEAFGIIEQLKLLIIWTSLIFLFVCLPYFVYNIVFDTCLVEDNHDSLYPWPFWFDCLLVQIECLLLMIPLIFTRLFDNNSNNKIYWLYHCIVAMLAGLFQLSECFGTVFGNSTDCGRNGDGRYGLIFYRFVSNVIGPILLGMQAYNALKLFMRLAEIKQFLCFDYKCLK